MSKRGHPKQQKQRENEYIDQIESEYLTHRFRRIIEILSKYYVYSFHLMIKLNQLYGNSFQRKVQKIVFVVQSLRYRCTKRLFSYFVRKLERRLQTKQKACLMIFEILQRPIIIINTQIFTSLNCMDGASKKLSKDKQLFLIIAFSNLSKVFNSAKIEGLEAIKYTSRQSRITCTHIKNEDNKAKIIALEFTLSKLIDSSLQKAFRTIKQTRQQITYFLKEDDQNGGDSDEEDIMIESFKSLAFNLRKMKEKQKLGRDIIKVKKQEGVKNLCGVLDELLKGKMKWTLWQLNWNCRNEYTPQTYQILVREIAVLEKEYQSN